MGTDVWPLLGRVKRELKAPLGHQHLLAPSRKVEDYEFLSIKDSLPGRWPSGLDVARCYALFGWLSGVDGRFFQVREIGLCGIAKVNAERFGEWLDTGSPTYHDTHDGGDVFTERYYSTYSDICIYDINTLMDLDYDQVARMDSTKDGQYKPHPENKTYRDLINAQRPVGWFEFLEEAKREQWDFVILRYWG